MIETMRNNYLAVLREEFEEYDSATDGFGDLMGVHSDDHVADPAELAACPFVLVETSRFGQTWVTAWPDPDKALQYHHRQEYAEDWTLQRLVDVRDLTEYTQKIQAVRL